MNTINWKNTHHNWGMIAILLHWLTALSVFFMFALGLWMVDLDYYSSWYHQAPFIHKSIGILLLMIMLARIIWRWSSLIPKPLPNYTAMDIRASTWVHNILYVLIFLTLLMGYIISTAEGDSISVFGWFEIPAIFPSWEDENDVAGSLHLWLASSLIFLAFFHALAAIKHHFIDKDNTLRRMINPKSK